MAKEMQEGKLNPNEGKLKALQAAMAKIEKDFGKGSIMKLGDEHVENIEVIPTGSIALDNALGVGGYPKGRIIEIYGPESSGKTTLAIHAIAELRRLAVSLLSLMQSTLSTVSMRLNWALMLITCGFHNQIMVSRRCRLQTS